MSTYTTIVSGTGTTGLAPPFDGKTNPNGIVIVGTTITDFDAAQLLVASGSQPADPLGHVTSLPIPSAYTISSNWLAITAHRWPFGPSAAPKIPYSAVRSHDYYINPKSLRWHHLETAAGVWDWSLFNQWVTFHKNNGTDIVYTAGFTPSFYAGPVPGYATGLEAYGTGTSTAPTDMQKWADYITAVCTRAMALGVDPSKWFIEVSNEPHFVAGFPKYFYSGTAAKLAEMTRVAYRAAKAVNSNIKILCAPVSKIEATGQAELTTYLDASAQGLTIGGDDGTGTTAANWVDIVSVHAYTTADGSRNYGSTVFTNAAAIRAIRDARATTGKPMWCTEQGYIDGGKVSEAVRRVRIPRLLLGSVCAGFERVFAYSVDHDGGMGIQTVPGMSDDITAIYSGIINKTEARANTALGGQLAVVFSDGSSQVM